MGHDRDNVQTYWSQDEKQRSLSLLLTQPLKRLIECRAKYFLCWTIRA